MSKKYVALNTMLSHINVNHKVSRQRAFNLLKVEEENVLPEVDKDASACQAKLDRMVSLFE